MLSVTGLTMRFGGLKAVDDLSFEARGRRHHRRDRPERRRQDHGVQLHHRLLPARPAAAIALTHAGRARVSRWTACPAIASPPRAKVARTFQNIRLFAGMTVLENLLVAQHNTLMARHRLRRAGGARPRPLPRRRGGRAWKKRGTGWMRIGLIDRADDPAGALPYGAQRRLEIARAMCIDPVLLCLDEPAAGLNPRETEELNQLLLTHPRRRLLPAADRARHGRGDAHLRPHRGAGSRQEDQRRHARPRSAPTRR